jgi:hypothetical protein
MPPMESDGRSATAAEELGPHGSPGEGSQPQIPEVAVEQPGKLLRIAMMIREMLEEVRRAPLDADAREHLAEIHDRVIGELKTALSGPLAEELARITHPFDDVPSEAELRIAHAQLLGWLEGLFQGIQAAIATQQMAMASQLEEMRRRALPPGQLEPRQPGEATPGQYL